MAIVKDFWAEPSYASLLLPMQDRVHKYVIAGEGTAKEALDALVDDWTEVFEDEGKLLKPSYYLLSKVFLNLNVGFSFLRSPQNFL